MRKIQPLATLIMVRGGIEMAIKDKVVVITGASSGIGEATAKLLADQGAKLVLGARHEEELRQITESIKQNGGDAVYRVTDVTKRDDNQQLVDYAQEQYGHVDVMFLNAGIMPVTFLSELQVDRWINTIDVNLKGVLYGIAAVLPVFKKQNDGQVIATSSVAGLQAYPGVAAYSATKFGVRAVMETLRLESAQEKSHIRTTTIYPGAVETKLMTNSGNNSNNVQFARMSPAEVANAVAYAIDQPENVSVGNISISAQS